MKILLYKNFSDAYELKEMKSGNTLHQAFPEVDFSKRFIIINGKKADENTIVKENDLVAVRSIPMDMERIDDGWRVVIGILTLGISESINAGIQTERNKRRLKELENSSSSSDSSSITELPYLRGATNSPATGKTQPFIIGRHLFTPNILNGNGSSYKGFHTIKGNLGETMFYNVVLENGFAQQAIEKIYTDDITIKAIGSEGVTPSGKYNIDTNSAFSSTDSFIEVRQDGNDISEDNFKYKIVEEELSDQLKKHPYSESDDGSDDDDYEDLYYTLEDNSKAVDVCLMFNGLAHYTSSGVAGIKERLIKLQYSTDYAALVAAGDSDPDGNATWTDFFLNTVEYIEPVYKRHAHHYQFVDSLNYSPVSANELWNYHLAWVDKGGETVTSKMTNLEITSTKARDTYGATIYQFDIYYDELITEGYTKETSTETTVDDVKYSKISLSKAYSKQIRFNAHADFTASEVYGLGNPVTIKVSTPDRKCNSETGSDVDDTYVQWIHSYTFDADSSSSTELVSERIIELDDVKRSTIIGCCFEATKANADKLDSIQVISQGVARTYSTTSGWSTTKTPTSNIASWVLEILTSGTHTLSQIDDSELDLDSFGAWYTYCEENDLNVNMVLTESTTKESILDNLVGLGNAILYKSIYGKVAVAIDKEKTSSIAVLNSQNIIDFSIAKDIGRKVDGMEFTFVNAEADFNSDTYTVYRDGTVVGDDTCVTSTSIQGITDHGQLVKYARRRMAIQDLRPETITAEVGKEGIFYTPLSKVLVQMPELQNGLGNATIKSLKYNLDNTKITGLVLYEPVEYDSSEEDGFGVVIQCIGDDYCTTLAKAYTATSDGKVTTITFVEPISVDASVIPHVRDTLSYGYLNDGEFETITSEYLIQGIDLSTNGVKLSLTNYNTAIYDTGDIPAYSPNITTPRKAVSSEISLPSVTVAEAQQIKQEAVTLAIPVSIKQYWAASESNTTKPTTFSDDPTSETATMTATKRYLWNYSIFYYSDGTTKQNGEAAVVGVYGEKGEPGSGFVLDLSPEQQTLLNTYIIAEDSTFQIKASFFEDDTDLHASSTFAATIDGTEVGTWEDTSDGKIVTIPCSALHTSSDLTGIVISATYEETTRTAIATVTKVYSGQDAVMYKMLFSATNIKEDAAGTKTPETISVEKRKVNANGESDTQKGYITVSVDGGDEQTTNTYINQSDKEYDSTATYYEAVEPFFLAIDENKTSVIGNGINTVNSSVVGGVFYD